MGLTSPSPICHILYWDLVTPITPTFVISAKTLMENYVNWEPRGENYIKAEIVFQFIEKIVFNRKRI